MKTSTMNRIHRNGASKRTASQAQTRDTEKQVRVVISDPDGDPFAEFEISETFHLAMRADAKAKGISLQQWIENAVREKYLAPTASAPAVEDDSVSLVFFSEKEGYSLAQVDLTRPKFEAIRAAASNAGLSLEELLNRGIMRMLDTVNFSTAELESAQYDAPAGSPPAAEPAPTIGGAEMELDLARLQSDALAALLADKLANLANSGTPFEGKLADNLCGGFAELARVTQERLDSAAAKFSQAVQSKLGEVAA